MAVATARTGGFGVGSSAVAVWSQIEVAYQPVDWRSVSACGWHVAVSAPSTTGDLMMVDD
jgi:hypothetical protein